MPLPLAEPNQKKENMGAQGSKEISLLRQKASWRRGKGNLYMQTEYAAYIRLPVCRLINEPGATKRWEALLCANTNLGSLQHPPCCWKRKDSQTNWKTLTTIQCTYHQDRQLIGMPGKIKVMLHLEGVTPLKFCIAQTKNSNSGRITITTIVIANIHWTHQVPNTIQDITQINLLKSCNNSDTSSSIIPIFWMMKIEGLK